MEKLFVTVSEACHALAVGRSKFYELVGAGKIPVRKLGKRTLIAVADLQHFADSLPSSTGATGAVD